MSCPFQSVSHMLNLLVTSKSSYPDQSFGLSYFQDSLSFIKYSIVPPFADFFFLKID